MTISRKYVVVNHNKSSSSSNERRFCAGYGVALVLSLLFNASFIMKGLLNHDDPLWSEPMNFYSNWDQRSLSLISTEKNDTINSMLYPSLLNTSIQGRIDNDAVRNSHEKFAACLLIMDDNHRLTEWLAYHSHVLPLDYLVVGIDPGSRTSPSHIFNEWRSHGMTIIEWGNTAIFRGRMDIYQNVIAKRKRMPHDHRQRQNMFLRNCLVHMKAQNRTWVMLTDSDEYLTFQGPQDTYNKRLQNTFTNLTIPPYPSVSENGAVSKFLQSPVVRSVHPSPCISIPRMLFGALNESTIEEQHKNIPMGYNATEFDTLRYRKHIQRKHTRTSYTNGWAKVIIDVSRVNETELPTIQEAFKTNGWEINVHRPVPKVCPDPFIKQDTSLFIINHYVGSWEAFSYRKDRRASEGRGYEKWEGKALQTFETDDDIRPWLDGFVKHHGRDKASQMLAKVGKFG